MNTKALLFEVIKRLAILKGQEISMERHQMYCEILEKYDPHQVTKAIKELATTQVRFPDISEIISKINSNTTDTDAANEILASIMLALAAYGPQQSKEVRQVLGPQAYFVVEAMGGWQTICNTTYSELNTLRAQIREMAKAAIKIASRRENDNLLQFQQSNADRMQNLGRLHYDLTSE